MGPLLMEGSWHREEQWGITGLRKGELENGRRSMEVALPSFPLLVSHSSEHFCSGLLVREVVGCTN